MGFMSDNLPSRHIVVDLSCRKYAAQRIMGDGKCFSRISVKSRAWLTKSKYPLMSNVSDDVVQPLSKLRVMSCINEMTASVVEHPGLDPNIVVGTSLWTPMKYDSRCACDFSNTFPMHSSN